MTELSFDQRRAILDKAVARYSKQGWRVISRTDTTAQLMRPKQFSCLWATLWTLCLGVGLIFYIFYYMSKKDEMLYLSIDEKGRIHKR